MFQGISMFQFPPTLAILYYGFTKRPAAHTGRVEPTAPAGAPRVQGPAQLAALAEAGRRPAQACMFALDENDNRPDAAAVQRADRQRQQDLRQRRQVESVLTRLRAGDGAPPFCASDPSGPHHCWRFDREVLELRPHQAFATGQDTGFEIHLHGDGLMARRDGQWIEDPSGDFLSALEAASRGPRQAFQL